MPCPPLNAITAPLTACRLQFSFPASRSTNSIGHRPPHAVSCTGVQRRAVHRRGHAEIVRVAARAGHGPCRWPALPDQGQRHALVVVQVPAGAAFLLRTCLRPAGPRVLWSARRGYIGELDGRKGWGWLLGHTANVSGLFRRPRLRLGCIAATLHLSRALPRRACALRWR